MAKKIFSQDASLFVLTLAEKLKEIPEFQAPEWSAFVKTGTSKERPPTQLDFWYVRAASVLRQLYIKGVVGVGRLRTRYGKRKDRGTKPDEFRKASGKIIRVILQQAEAAGLVEKLAHLQHGRRLTQKGRDFLDSIDAPSKAALDLTDILVHKKPEDEEEVQETDEAHTEGEEVAKEERAEQTEKTQEEAEQKEEEKEEHTEEESTEEVKKESEHNG